MKIVGAGLSGLIGRPLTDILKNEHELVLFRRGASHGAVSGVRQVLWNPSQIDGWAREIDGADAVINLAGENIADKRWTARQKQKIRDSRIQATNAMVEAIAHAKQKPKVLVNGSALGYYGPWDETPLREDAPAGVGFLPEVCVAWEEAARKAEAYGVRTVRVRTGIVLARQGGALQKMLPPFRYFIGGPVGSGIQILSWIHLEDEVGGIIHCLKNDSVNGAVNLAAPEAVAMKSFAKTLGRVLGRPAVLPVPAFALKILLGEMSEMLLTGQKVVPQKLLDSGYRFKYPTLESALRNLL